MNREAPVNRPIMPRAMTPEQLRAWQERKRSNAAGPHRDRRRRRTSRRTERNRAIRESMGE